jgi:hypothetical protein
MKTKKLTRIETIQILKDYNAWRRGDESIENPLPTEIGHAIDRAIELLNQPSNRNK